MLSKLLCSFQTLNVAQISPAAFGESQGRGGEGTPKVSQLWVLFWMTPSFPRGLSHWIGGKESTCNAGDTGDAGSIPGLGRSTRVGNG